MRFGNRSSMGFEKGAEILFGRHRAGHRDGRAQPGFTEFGSEKGKWAGTAPAISRLSCPPIGPRAGSDGTSARREVTR